MTHSGSFWWHLKVIYQKVKCTNLVISVTYCLYIGRYVRITSENIQVLLGTKDGAYLMELASACINKQVIIFSRLQDDLL